MICGGFLYCVSNFPKCNLQLNSSGLSLDTSNQNNAYQITQDYCYNRKTECLSNSKNINICCTIKNPGSNDCTGNLPLAGLPSILSYAAQNPNTNGQSDFVNNYNILEKWNDNNPPERNGCPIPSFPQGRLSYFNFCTKYNIQNGKKVYPNWLTQDCKNFYQNVYTAGGEIDPCVSTFLTEQCANETVGDPKSKDVCGCYYPDSVYDNFKVKNNITDFENVNRQCFYPDCFFSKNPRKIQSTANCPSIINCNATVINNLKAGGDIKNNKVCY